jgi:glutaredoxin 3
MVAKILIYSARFCPYCRMAERLLATKKVEIEKVMVDENPVRRDEMTLRAGQTSVPQIFIGDIHVGGFAELAGLERTGKLDVLLE